MQQRTHTPPQPPSLTTREPLQGHGARVGDALHALCSPTTEPWPDGTIARYLTAAGATVDLTLRHTLPPESKPYATLADCNGCPAAEEFGHYRTVWGLYSEREEHNPNAAETDARKWAQRHASECRALPRPAVNQ